MMKNVRNISFAQVVVNEMHDRATDDPAADTASDEDDSRHDDSLVLRAQGSELGEKGVEPSLDARVIKRMASDVAEEGVHSSCTDDAGSYGIGLDLAPDGAFAALLVGVGEVPAHDVAELVSDHGIDLDVAELCEEAFAQQDGRAGGGQRHVIERSTTLFGRSDQGAAEERDSVVVSSVSARDSVDECEHDDSLKMKDNPRRRALRFGETKCSVPGVKHPFSG